MAMRDFENDWTIAMLDALPEDDQRYEIIDGVLYVTPAPRVRHQHVVSELLAVLVPHVRRCCRAVALAAPTDIRKGDRTSIQPDILVVKLDGQGHVDQPIPPADLLLVVEVLSERTARVDRGEKRQLYQREGVAEYWIVDSDSWIVERWRPQDQRPEVLSERIEWHCREAAEPLVIELPAFFASLVPE